MLQVESMDCDKSGISSEVFVFGFNFVCVMVLSRSFGLSLWLLIIPVGEGKKFLKNKERSKERKQVPEKW